MRAIAIVAILALMLPFAGTAEAVNVTVDPATLNLAHLERVVRDARSEAIAERP